MALISNESGRAPIIKNNSASNELPPLKGGVSYFFKKWKLFAIIGLVGGIMGVIYSSIQKTQYESRLTFALDEGGSGGLGDGLSSLVAQFGFNMGNSNDVFGGDNILTILKSRRIIEKVLLSVDTFQSKPQTIISYFLSISRSNKHGGSSIDFPLNTTRENLSRVQDSMLFATYTKFEKEYISVSKPDKFLNVFEVNVVSVDERFTKIFTDRLIAETNSFYTGMRSKKAKETLDILEQRVATMKGNMNESVSNKAAIQDANLNPAFAASQVPIQKQQINMQVYSGAYAELFKNLELARYQYLKEIPLMQIIDAADYPMKKVKPGKIICALIFSFLSISITFLILWGLSTFKNFRVD